jgi:hypothetical protein
MRNLRDNANGADTVPDPLRDPDGYKRVMRLKIFKRGNPDGNSE